MSSYYSGSWIFLDLTLEDLQVLKSSFGLQSIPYLDALESRFIAFVTNKPAKGYYPIGLLSNQLLPNLNIATANLNAKMFHITNNIIDNIIMTELQHNVIQKVLDHTNTCLMNYRPVACCINTPCASGKTVIAVKLISILKMRTYVVVPTRVMINQWLRELRINNINSVGSYDGSKTLMESISQPPDVLVIVSRHLSNPELVKYLTDNYSVGIFDEIHMFNLQNSTSVSTFLISSSPLYSYFLTATPKSNNEVFTGKLITSDFQIINTIQTLHVYSKTTENIQIEDGDSINEDKMRNNSIITSLLEYFLDNSILVLTTSRNHMNFLYRIFVNILISKYAIVPYENDNKELYKFNINNVEYYVMLADAKSKSIHSNTELVHNKDNLVIFSTYKLCSTGLNIPNLNMLVMGLNNIDNITLMQSVGRIMRPSKYNNKYVVMFKGIEINRYSKEQVTNFLSDINNQIITLKRLNWNIVKS